MRIEPSMDNQGEFGSPHISRMEGDLSKIHPLGHHDRRSSECAEKDNRNITDTQRSHVASVERGDGSHRAIMKQNYQNGSTMIQPVPQSASWSNVVSSSSPIKFTRSSDETILTSHTATSTHPNVEYANLQSRSFDTNEEGSHVNYLPQSIALGQNMTPTRPQNSWGMTLPHPPSYRDASIAHLLPTINQGVQGPSTPLQSPMMYSTPHHTFECFSPLSLCDSTDQTTPMSSPSMSPHFVPMQSHQEPSFWQLSPSPSNPNADSNDMHSQTPQRFRPPEPIRNFYQLGPLNHQGYGHHRAQQGYMHPRSYGSVPVTSPKHHHAPNASTHQQHGGQARRTGLASSGPMNRSPTEVLKTLLRKKACLYEPETSSAVALVTWLVGRRLAISHGFFSRHQLQLGVHSCVASKIKDGYVTRTKVNRCMQIILNSCFHYIIPRSDGSEESGDLFRQAFFRDAEDDEHLLKTLSPPWNNLSLDATDVDEGNIAVIEGSDDDASHQSPRNHGKHSSSASHAGESVDSGKRSVLLCFNENIRSAADVLRCHNEFVRDVAHAANLNLSIEDWKNFYCGSKGYKKKSLCADTAAQTYFNFIGGTSNAGSDRMDQQGLAKFHTSWCAKRYEHDHSLCTFAHTEVNRGWLRRNPFIYKYKPVLCPDIIPLPASGDCFMNVCPHGVNCNFAHSREEIIYHPESYKKNPCNNTANVCPLRDICPNAHDSKSHGYLDAASHGYNRHGKRHHATPRKAASNSHGQSAGFTKRPDGSPMLYIDPAPPSDFEDSLLLPGLRAIFRDFSNSIYNSLHMDDAREYGLFGYKSVSQKVSKKTPLASIGKRERGKL